MSLNLVLATISLILHIFSLFKDHITQNTLYLDRLFTYLPICLYLGYSIQGNPKVDFKIRFFLICDTVCEVYKITIKDKWSTYFQIMFTYSLSIYNILIPCKWLMVWEYDTLKNSQYFYKMWKNITKCDALLKDAKTCLKYWISIKEPF